MFYFQWEKSVQIYQSVWICKTISHQQAVYGSACTNDRYNGVCPKENSYASSTNSTGKIKNNHDWQDGDEDRADQL